MPSPGDISRLSFPLVTLVSLAAAPGLTAQSSSRIQQDMEFARGLAERFAYTDMAEAVIADLDQAGLSGKDAEGLALLKCEVYAAGAKGARRVEDRLPLFDKSLEAYRKFIDENEYSDYLPTAQRDYVSQVNDYARLLAMELEDQLGAEAETTREKIKSVIDAGLELTSDLIDSTDNATTQVEKNERWRLMLNRAQMLLTLANVSGDGTYLYTRAESTLEQLIGEAGDRTGAGMQGFLLLAQVKLNQGDPGYAFDCAGYVFDTVMPLDAETRAALKWSEMPFAEKASRWIFAELALRPVCEAKLAQGDLEEACRYALAFYNDWRVEGFDISPIGNLSLLAAASALVEAGGWIGGQLNGGNLTWFETQEAMNGAGFNGGRNTRSAYDLALSIAQGVNEENRGNTLQQRAQKVISRVIEQPGVEVSPDILFEAAQGDYYADEFDRAREGLKGIMRQLDGRDEATQQEYMPRVLLQLGKAYEKEDRSLEAAMTYREAANNWAGDPEYDPQIADAYYKAVGRAKAGTGGDPMLEQLYLAAEEALKVLGEGGGKIAFRQAERLYGKDDFAGARTLYLQIEPGTDDYERAVVKAALCQFKLKDEDTAAAEFARYLNEYVTDPRNKPVDAAKIASRSEAMAQATYYLGYISYRKGDWATVIEHFENYAKEFPEQTSYAPNALYMAAKARLEAKELGKAKAILEELIEKFPEASATGNTAFAVYDALGVEKEAAEAAGETEKVRTLSVEMAENINLFNRVSDKPSYDSLRRESSLWLDLGEWARAEEALRRIVDTLADREQDNIEKHIKPDLGLALLEQKRIPDAFKVLDELIPRTDDDTRKPSSKTVERWCRSVTGWLESDDRNFVEVPGVGGAENLKVACDYLRKLTDAEGAKEKYTGPWYELKFETAYGYYEWGKVDSSQTNSVVAQIENLQNLLSDKRLDPITDAMEGDDTLTRKFLWLLDQAK